MLVANGPDTKTNGRLFAALGGKLSERHHASLFFRHLPRGALRKALYILQPDFRLVGVVLAADTIIIHTAASLSLPLLALARISGKRSIIFLWDDYSRSGAPGCGVAVLERTAISLCDRVLVPSTDYVRSPDARATSELTVFPLWTSGKTRVAQPVTLSVDDSVRVVFAGQINLLRGLDKVLLLLSRRACLRFRIDIFSDDPVPEMPVNLANLDIAVHGYITPDILDQRLPEFHFGLVSLDPDLPAPAFPSKILTYIAAGLPVLYHGPELAALTGTLENGGLGVVLRDQDCATFRNDLARVRQGFPQAQAKYLRHCRLSWNRLAAVL